MNTQAIERLIDWLKDAPHYPRCNAEFGEQLCSCGKKDALEMAELMLDEAKTERML